MEYAFNFQGATFTPDGKADIQTDAVSDHNRAVEQVEIERIKTGPDKLFLYVGKKPMPQQSHEVHNGLDPKFYVGKDHYCVQTWLGTWLGWAWLGPRAVVGFQDSRRYGSTYRRAITVRVFGALYHGWYMESSGDYCRLKRAKLQDGRYAATIAEVRTNGR